VKHPNYNHLLYFWTHITPQTISGQIKLLEAALAGRLLEKKGRRVAPTELGLRVYEYADEIFSRGQDLIRVLQGMTPHIQPTVTIGVSDVVPNLVAWRVIGPLMRGEHPFRVVCHTGSLDTLVTDLGAHRLDLVLSTSALTASSGFRGYSHLLGECEISFFAPPRMAASLRRNFPDSLDQMPFLLPSGRSPNRRILDDWFTEHGITPQVVGEFDDSGLLKTFGQAGLGVFAAPSAIEQEVVRQCKARIIGKADGARARFYALSMERKIRHPAVVQIMAGARGTLFRD
jgi:LysR family transcriptional regulator, transcriptional activator of nhaA